MSYAELSGERRISVARRDVHHAKISLTPARPTARCACFGASFSHRPRPRPRTTSDLPCWRLVSVLNPSPQTHDFQAGALITHGQSLFTGRLIHSNHLAPWADYVPQFTQMESPRSPLSRPQSWILDGCPNAAQICIDRPGTVDEGATSRSMDLEGRPDTTNDLDFQGNGRTHQLP